MKQIITLLTISSLVVLAGCTSTPTVDSNTIVDNTTDNIGIAEGMNSNENAEAVRTGRDLSEGNVNTSAEGGNADSNVESDEVDTSDWLTYSNEDYGFSLKYPSKYPLAENENQIIGYRDPDYRYQIKIFVRENVITESMSTEEALLYEDGRELLPLVEGQEIVINSLQAYRALRQLGQGDRLYPNSDNQELVSETWTAVEYNYITEKDIIRAWFTIKGEQYEELIKLSDTIASTLQIE